MRLGLAMVLALCGAPQMVAQTHSIFAIKGHAIGETIATFLTAEPGIQSALDDCHHRIPKQISWDELKRRKMDSLEKSLYERQAKAGLLYDRDPAEYHSKCDRILATADRGAVGDIEANGATFTFDQGNLVKISSLLKASNENGLDDAIEKFGKPTRQDAIAYHNGFGATWQNQMSVWDLPGAYVMLFADGNPSGGDWGPLLTVESRGERQKEEAAEKARKNSVDQ